MSLIETCLSVGLIATVTAIAAPTLLQTKDDYVLKSAARDVATKLHAARIQAISRNRDCRLRVTSSVAYVIECENPAWTVSESLLLPRGIYLAANARPEFHPLGNVAPTATVTLWNVAGRQRKVIVNNGGRIRIE